MYFTIAQPGDNIKSSKGKEIKNMFKKISEFLAEYYSEFAHRAA